MGTRTSGREDADGVCDEWVVSDFTRTDEIVRCAESVRAAEPDILVNNAGINVVAPFVDILPADFEVIQRVNVYAPFRLCQAAVPAMVRNGWGRIVNISSIWGTISREHRASYSASKFAVDGMTVALAAEHTADGVLANCIAPGFIDTELTRRVLGEDGMNTVASAVPARRLGNADEIARLVLWLSSDENTYVAGQNIAIDGGFSRV